MALDDMLKPKLVKKNQGKGGGSVSTELKTAAKELDAHHLKANANPSSKNVNPSSKNTLNHSRQPSNATARSNQPSQSSYHDDFESYDEDFEEFQEEDGGPDGNVVSGAPPISSVTKTKTHVLSTASLTLKPSKMEIHSSRQRDLMKLIQFDLSIYPDVFELKPKSQLEMMVRAYSTRSISNTSCQTGHDSREIHLQTEDWDVTDAWCQAPPSELIESAFVFPSLPWITSALSKKDSKKESTKKSKLAEYTPRLGTVLNRAARVMDILLQESENNAHEDNFISEHDHELLKHPSLMNHASFFEGKVALVQRIPQSSLMIVCWTNPSQPIMKSNPLIKSVIGFYKIGEDSLSNNYLVCYPTITTLFTTLNAPSLVFAGTKDGSIQVWDTTRQSTKSETINSSSSKSSFNIQWPSFMSDFNAHHQNEIVALFQVSATDQTRSSFQISSLDQDGFIQNWVVLTSNKTVESAQDDHVKLNASSESSFKLPYNPFPKYQTYKDNKPEKLCLFTHPDAHNFIVASSNTAILSHHSKYTSTSLKRRVFPKHFELDLESSTICERVTCIKECPFNPAFFVVGYQSGLLSFYSTHYSTPRFTIRVESGVCHVVWSDTRPVVLYVLEQRNGTMHVFDLAECVDCSVYQVELGDGVDVFDVGVSLSSLGGGGAGSRWILYGDASGNVGKCRIDQGLNELQGDEKSQLESLFI